jgi:hypothetical protein
MWQLLTSSQHGHNMYVLARGTGTWDGTVTNPSNPSRRDVTMLPNGSAATPSYLVVQIDGDNPGVWPVSCLNILCRISPANNVLRSSTATSPGTYPQASTSTSSKCRKISKTKCESLRSWRRLVGTGQRGLGRIFLMRLIVGFDLDPSILI